MAFFFSYSYKYFSLFSDKFLVRSLLFVTFEVSLALKVLLVDSDDEWLDQAETFLQEQLYEVKVVSNGKDAQLELYNDKFFAIIINFDVKNHSGAQVLKFISMNHPSQRVIVVVESAERMEKDDFSEEQIRKMAVVEIAIKPFELTHLKDLLEGHQSLNDLMSTIHKKKGVSKEEEVTSDDDQFTSIKIDEFYSSKAVLFDVFVKLKSNRYIKILHAGDQFTKDRIDKYKNEKKVEYLHFKNCDRRKYIQYHNYLAKKMINTEIIPASSKMKMLQNTASKFAEEVFTEGVKPQIVDQGKMVCENIYSMVEKQKDLYKLLRGYQEFDPNAYTHAFLTSMFTTCIIKQFDWQSKVTIETTALACLFHDIGKMKLPRELLELRPIEMNDEELDLYKTHPELGVEIIEGNRMINNSVKQIILQHHENYDGTGFPSARKGSKILTLSNILCLANDFVHVITDNEVAPVVALKMILTDEESVSKYNSMIIENFIKVFVDPGAIEKETSTLPSNSRLVNKKAS